MCLLSAGRVSVSSAEVISSTAGTISIAAGEGFDFMVLVEDEIEDEDEELISC